MKILIVEDDRKQSQPLKKYLDYNGYECKIVEYRLEAIQMIQNMETWKFDCAIVDVQLRDEKEGYQNGDENGGLSVATALKEKSIPFIIFSDHISQSYQVLIEDLKIDNENIFVKPTSPRIILNRLTKLK
jgi:DNA-binding response OmpR family regulator